MFLSHLKLVHLVNACRSDTMNVLDAKTTRIIGVGINYDSSSSKHEIFACVNGSDVQPVWMTFEDGSNTTKVHGSCEPSVKLIMY